ncbi:carbon-nitrogen hydrolase family protein [Candidatus Bathyarchaeota archaeon]|nr:carbon-nitrogen hydrolase family protein [Candidatus Bathyarchaeota archaeon]
MRISLIHMKTRETLKETLTAAKEKIHEAAQQNPQFIALPEYFTVPGFIEKYQSAQQIHRLTYTPTINLLKTASKEHPNLYIIGGTLIEKAENGAYYNTCTIWKAGQKLAAYRKRTLIKAEENLGLAKANQPLVLETPHCKIGILICADIFNPTAVEETTRKGAEIIFLPVASLHAHPHVEGHPLTQKIATEKNVIIAKIGNVRSDAKGGRSAIITPWGIIAEADDSPTDIILTADINLTKLRNQRKPAA